MANGNAENELIDKGQLQVNVTSEINRLPIRGAKVSISYTGVPGSTLTQLQTDISGQTEVVELNTPPLEYSLDVTFEEQPYSEYTLDIQAAGYQPIVISV